MEQREMSAIKARSLYALYLKCGAILLLLALSVLVVACGAGSTARQADLGAPQVTVTIQLGNNGSPMPATPDYLCGAWITDTTPKVGARTITVNMKFIHSVSGNPEGVGSAIASATVTWADLTQSTQHAQTTADGLAVISFNAPADKTNLVNKNNIVTATFTSPDGKGTCTVDEKHAAYFVFIMTSPTVVPPSPTPVHGGQPPQPISTPPHRRGGG